MADIKPKGIDQTTGQERTVETTDSLVGNIGDEIEIAITQVYDFSGNVRNNVQVLFPWGAPQKLNEPASAPGINAHTPSWSPNGEFLAVTAGNAPRLSIYQRTGQTLNRLTDPTTIPGSGSSAYGGDWSPDGEFFSIAASTSPFIYIYQRDGSTLTKLPDPASLPQGGIFGPNDSVRFAPNGEFLAVGVHSAAPFLMLYQRDGTTFTKLPDPASAPQTSARAVAWSPNGEFLAATSVLAPYLHIYQREGTTFTRLPDPASLPPTIASFDPASLDFSPNSEFLAYGASGNASHKPLFIYQRSGTTFSLLADPASLPPNGSVLGVAWSPNGKFLATFYSGSPGMFIYERDGTTFTKLADPASIPFVSGIQGGEWSPNQEFLPAIDVGGFINLYQTGLTMPNSGIVTIQGSLGD
jgi:WD40 repeat protein